MPTIIQLLILVTFAFASFGIFDAAPVFAEEEVEASQDETEADKPQKKKRKKRKRRKKRKGDTEENGAVYEQPYGMAGCGLWSMVIKDNTMGAQLGIYALRYFVINSQTSAITTGTSNCVAPKNSYAQQEKEVFVSVNLNSLSKEAAQGGGAHLQSFAQVLGCSDFDAFAKMSQTRYNSIFSSDEPNAVLQNYMSEVKADKHLAKNCIRAS